MNTQTNYKRVYTPSIPIPPGETLLEVLDEKGMTQAELARRLNRPLKTINEIVRGKSALTTETALQLEQVLGVSASFWNNLEALYRELIARREMEKAYSLQKTEVKKYPYKEMAKWGWVQDVASKTERVKNLLSFFAVTSFENVVEEQYLKGVYRISRGPEYSIPAITAWLRKGVIDSELIETEDFDRNRLENVLPKLRSLTRIDDPNQFMPDLRGSLAACGVAFITTPSLPKAPINGSTRWLKPNKAIIQLSLRYKFSDIFWFTLFHEIGHLLNEGKKDFIIDILKNPVQEEKERRADRFACDLLIPKNDYEKLTANLRRKGKYTSPYAVIASFAESTGVHAGIVTGRLQHDKVLRLDMNKLRTRFEWTK